MYTSPLNTQYNWFSELIFDQEKIEIKSERFDLDLFLLDSSNYEKKLLEWEEENKGFFKLLFTKSYWNVL